MLETMAEYLWIYYLLAFPIVIITGSCFLRERRRPRDFLLVLAVSIIFSGIGSIPNPTGHGPSGVPPPFWIWFIWFYNDPGLMIHPFGWLGILYSAFISTLFLLPTLLLGRLAAVRFDKWTSRPPRH